MNLRPSSSDSGWTSQEWTSHPTYGDSTSIVAIAKPIIGNWSLHVSFSSFQAVKDDSTNYTNDGQTVVRAETFGDVYTGVCANPKHQKNNREEEPMDEEYGWSISDGIDEIGSRPIRHRVDWDVHLERSLHQQYKVSKEKEEEGQYCSCQKTSATLYEKVILLHIHPDSTGQLNRVKPLENRSLVSEYPQIYALMVALRVSDFMSITMIRRDVERLDFGISGYCLFSETQSQMTRLAHTPQNVQKKREIHQTIDPARKTCVEHHVR